MRDFGLQVAGEIWGDAQAALGSINRKGLGKTRHIQTGFLWVQQVAAEKRLKYGKVLGKENPADLYTKYLDWATMGKHMNRVRYEVTTGRASEARKLHSVSMSMDEYGLMGLWKPWEWLDIITDAVQCQSAKPKVKSRQITCAGEINVVSRRLTSLEQPVLQGYKRQVQGYNWLNPAQPSRPWGSTQTLPSEHNRVKHPCSDGHVTGIETWGIARMPRVVPREDRIRLLREKGPYKERMPNKGPEKEGAITITGMGPTTSNTTERTTTNATGMGPTTYNTTGKYKLHLVSPCETPVR